MKKSTAAANEQNAMVMVFPEDAEIIRKIRAILRTGKEVLLELDSDGNTQVSSLTLEECGV